jgi:hypothetical protein
MVDNLGGHVAELKERGLAVGAIETQPGRFRKAEVTDPNRDALCRLIAECTQAGHQQRL